MRGPYDLPEPVESEAQAVMQGVIHRANPKYRTQPEETKDQIWDAFVAEWGTACWYCGQAQNHSRRVLQLDHVEPNLRDGSNDDCWNRALACIDCNGDKSDKLTPEQTIDLALAVGRIPTPARARRTKRGFSAADGLGGGTVGKGSQTQPPYRRLTPARLETVLPA